MAPLNTDVDKINFAVLKMLPGDEHVTESADSLEDDRHIIDYPIEHLHSLTPAGLPPHRLAIKIGMPLILLRNLNMKAGLCNGTRITVRRVVGNHIIHGVIATGPKSGDHVLIPRITMSSKNTDFPFPWKRTQFPVRPAFAITINKSQGQDLERVGVWLERPVFTHGQLYVCASRVGHPNNIRFAIRASDDIPPSATRNVVYREILTR